MLFREARLIDEATLTYVLSDDTVDRYGDVIVASGWKLSNFKRSPIALFNHDAFSVIGGWENVRVEANKLIGQLRLAAAGTAPLVDYVRNLITQKFLRAVSVGFVPLKDEALEGSEVGGRRYTECELVECSVVAVPANPNAIQIGKAFNLSASERLVLGKIAKVDDRAAARRALPARSPNLLPAGRSSVKTSLAKQIETAQADINNLKDQLTTISENEERSEEDEKLLTELPGQIEAMNKRLGHLQSAEKALAIQVASGDPDPQNPNPVKRPFAVPAKKLEPRDLIVKGATVAFLSHALKKSTEDIIRSYYGEDEGMRTVLRAVTNPAMTTVPGWAQELAQTGIADFLESLQPISVYARLSGIGARFTFGRNATIRIPSRAPTPNVSGAWVGEGQPIPVRRLGLTAIALTPKKLGVISTFTREIALHSTPAIEGVIREAMNDDTAITVDATLLDDQPASAIRPAGLRNGVVGLTPSTETDPLAMVADLKSLVGAITAVNGGRSIVIMMNTKQSMNIAFQQTTTGDFLFPSTDEAGRRLGVTFIASNNVPVDTVICVDAADFASATGDTPEYDVSDQATIHEEDTAPLPIVGPGGTPVTASPVRSLWQTASIGVRMLLDMNWAMRRTGMVSWMTGVTW